MGPRSSKSKKNSSEALDEIRYEDQKKEETYVEADRDFWPARYYRETRVRLLNPTIKESAQELAEICQGTILPHFFTYDGLGLDGVQYLETPITVTTKSGYSKEVYLSRGICRDLFLFKSRSTDSESIDASRKLRKKLAAIEIQFVYTEKSFISRLEFETPYSDVDFVVR